MDEVRAGDAPEKVTLLTSLRDAKAWLKARLREGAACPLCDQHAQMYRRKITSTMAQAMIQLWRAAGTDWAHLPTVVGAKRADEAKLVYWGLLEEERAIKRDDGGRAGWWRLTDDGALFVHGQLHVSKYALVYNGRCFGFEGEQVSIEDCLGARFRLDELLA